MGQYTEGQRLQGSDGNVYVVRNGVPVREGPPLTKPSFPYEGPQAAANLQRTQQEIEQANATAAANAAKAKAEAESAQIKAQTDKEAYDAAHPKGTGSTVFGPAFLKTLSGPDAELVKALAEGRLAFPGGFALKAPWWQQKLEQVAQYDPSFDATNYNNRAKARASLVNGKLGASSNALNTAIGHVGHLGEQISGTSSLGGFPFATDVNALINAYNRHEGKSGITNFQDTAQKLADELESVYRNGGGAEQGVVRQLRSLDPNASAEQKRGIVANALELLASKQAANLYQYNIGSGGKPPVDLLDPAAHALLDQFSAIRDKYFAPVEQPISHAAATLVTQHGGVPPSGPSGAPPVSTGGPPPLSGGPGGGQTPWTNPSAPAQGIATGATRHESLGSANAAMNALVQRGRPYQEAVAWAQQNNIPAPPPGAYASALAWQQAHPRTPYTGSDIYRDVPTTTFQRISGGPIGGYAAGAGDALTAGYSDELAGLASSLTGGDYTQGRDAFNARKNILEATNPTANLVGNMTGGAISLLAPEALASKFAPGAAAAVPRMFGKFAPAVTDAAYGAAYGSGENNDNRLAGAVENGIFAPVVGGLARAGTRGVANVVSPPEGAFGPTYAQGVFPTVGQRFGGSGLTGKIINTTEQAMQSVPFLGSMVSKARQIPRDAFQIGGFNDALGEIGQKLPPGTGPGTEAHSFTSGAFDNAYDQARSGMQFLPDQQYQADKQAFDASLGNGTLDAQQAAQVQQRINTAVDSRLAQTNGALPGDAYKAAASDLGATQRQWAKTDPLKADALNNYLTIFDDAARRNSDPNAVAKLDQADNGYAKLVRLQRASELGGVGKDAGTFTPNNLSTAVKQTAGGVRSGPYLRGDALLQDYADAGRGLSDTLPNSGTADRLMTARGLGMEAAGTGAAGYAAMHAPGALAMFAPYAPGLRMFASRAIAPRRYTLPPNLAAPLDALSSQIQNRAPIVGKLAVAPALQWWEQP